MLHDNLGVNDKGHLTIGSLDCVELAAEYGTPAYILDTDKVRSSCRTYKKAIAEHFAEGSGALYASKALSYTGIYRIMKEEGMGVDCVSPGEIATALRAGFPAGGIYFHGNNKTRADLEYALSSGIGTIVVDNDDELDMLDTLCEHADKKQCILLRITPGIDPHTHKAVVTGNVDSKFGNAISTGQAAEIVGRALTKKHLDLCGLHCHIGSQIFEPEPFADAASIMVRFTAEIKNSFGYELRELNLGGGYGVRYTENDREIDYAGAIASLSRAVENACEKYAVRKPAIVIEPGRSIVAAAGLTLYTVGAVKEIPSFRNYISVDGGMADNPRYALYQSRYTVLIANRAAGKKDYIATVAGRCCESGDLIGEALPIQKPEKGDILAVLCTGAYNYSMASNYNRLPRPPIIDVHGGNSSVAVRRETFDDLMACDI